MQATRTSKHVLSIICFAISIFFCVFYIGSIILPHILQKMPSEVYTFIQNNTFAGWFVSNIPLYLIGMPIFLLILKQLPDGEDIQRPNAPFTPDIKTFFLIIICAFGISYAMNLISTKNFTVISFVKDFFNELFPPLNRLSEFFNENISRSNSSAFNYEAFTLKDFPVNFFFMAIVPAFGEEFLFRHMLYRKMRGSGDKFYIILSGFAFGLFHGNFVQAVYATTLGFVLAYIYLQTRNLKYNILIHMIFNAFSVILLTLLNLASKGKGVYIPPTDTTPSMVITPLYILIILINLIITLSTIPLAIYMIGKIYKKITPSLLPATEVGWPGFTEAKNIVEKKGYFNIEPFEFEPFKNTPLIIQDEKKLEDARKAQYFKQYPALMARQDILSSVYSTEPPLNHYQNLPNIATPYHNNISGNKNSGKLRPPELAIPYRKPIQIKNSKKDAQSPSLLNIFYMIFHNPFGITATVILVLPLIIEFFAL